MGISVKLVDRTELLEQMYWIDDLCRVFETGGLVLSTGVLIVVETRLVGSKKRAGDGV